jgi:hypothetical protein
VEGEAGIHDFRDGIPEVRAGGKMVETALLEEQAEAIDEFVLDLAWEKGRCHCPGHTPVSHFKCGKGGRQGFRSGGLEQ